jgi:ribonuclease HII
MQFPVTTESPMAVLIDGARYQDMKVIPGIEVFAEDKLDNACVSVALASICAKVHQEANMRGLDFLYPEYGFAGNNGYPTPAHKAAVEEHGISHQHRKTWGK